MILYLLFSIHPTIIPHRTAVSHLSLVLDIGEMPLPLNHIFNIFSLNGRERDKYTESGTAGQIVRKRDCPAESGTVVPPKAGRLDELIY